MMLSWLALVWRHRTFVAGGVLAVAALVAWTAWRLEVARLRADLADARRRLADCTASEAALRAAVEAAEARLRDAAATAEAIAAGCDARLAERRRACEALLRRCWARCLPTPPTSEGSGRDATLDCLNALFAGIGDPRELCAADGR